MTVEGLETADQAERMRELGVEFAQGFYFARPLAPEAALELMRERVALEEGITELPVVVSRAAARTGGADSFLGKPFRLPEVVERVELMLHPRT